MTLSEGVKLSSVSSAPMNERSSGSGNGLSRRHAQPTTHPSPPTIEFDSVLQSSLFFPNPLTSWITSPSQWYALWIHAAMATSTSLGHPGLGGWGLSLGTRALESKEPARRQKVGQVGGQNIEALDLRATEGLGLSSKTWTVNFPFRILRLYVTQGLVV